MYLFPPPLTSPRPPLLPAITIFKIVLIFTTFEVRLILISFKSKGTVIGIFTFGHETLCCNNHSHNILLKFRVRILLLNSVDSVSVYKWQSWESKEQGGLIREVFFCFCFFLLGIWRVPVLYVCFQKEY